MATQTEHLLAQLVEASGCVMTYAGAALRIGLSGVDAATGVSYRNLLLVDLDQLKSTIAQLERELMPCSGQLTPRPSDRPAVVEQAERG